MGVTDADGLSINPGMRGQMAELLHDRVFIDDRIEKNIPAGRRQMKFPGRAVSDGLGRGETVDEKKTALLDGCEGGFHFAAAGGETRTHVIVDARGKGDILDIRAHDFQNAPVIVAFEQSAGAWTEMTERLHGLMQHDRRPRQCISAARSPEWGRRGRMA